MKGINDIGHSTSADLLEQDVSADQIIAGMKQIIARVHERGAKIYGATLTPYESTTFHGYYQPAGEAKREAVNAWIRSGGSFDAVIDFDAVVRDPDHPTRIRSDFDVGDHLHPKRRRLSRHGRRCRLEAVRVAAKDRTIRNGARRNGPATPSRWTRFTRVGKELWRAKSLLINGLQVGRRARQRRALPSGRFQGFARR